MLFVSQIIHEQVSDKEKSVKIYNPEDVCVQCVRLNERKGERLRGLSLQTNFPKHFLCSMGSFVNRMFSKDYLRISIALIHALRIRTHSIT